VIAAQAIAALTARELRSYEQSHPASARLEQLSTRHWQGGVPFQWMRDWGLPFPLYVRSGRGATLIDVDGRAYDRETRTFRPTSELRSVVEQERLCRQ
jgi:4-aminobutyrate aminotransferase-like enzyme